jgi:hypothetical protein
MRPVVSNSSLPKYIGVPLITISAGTNSPSPLDSSVRKKADDLFALVAEATLHEKAINEARSKVAKLLGKPGPDADEVKEAEAKVAQLLEERYLKIDEIGKAQGEVTRLLEGPPLAGCKISGLGDEVTVSFDDPEKAPVRELLLLVAVNACSPATIDLALGVVKAMASNQQLAPGHKAWRSHEGQEAVRALEKLTAQMNSERMEALLNGRPQPAYLHKAIPETASAIVTLIQRAKLASPGEEDTAEMQSILQKAESNVKIGTVNALGRAQNLLNTGNEYEADEANKLLGWAAGLTLVPTQLPNGHFSENAVEWMLANLTASSNLPQKLLGALYQRDKLAYTKVALAQMQKAVVNLEPGHAENVLRQQIPGMRDVDLGRYAQSDRDMIRSNTSQLIKVCAADPNFLELVRRSPKYIALYTQLTGSPFPV